MLLKVILQISHNKNTGTETTFESSCWKKLFTIEHLSNVPHSHPT